MVGVGGTDHDVLMNMRFLTSVFVSINLRVAVASDERGLWIDPCDRPALLSWIESHRADARGNDASEARLLAELPILDQGQMDRLARALRSIDASASRMRGIRAGRIPGAMSGREVMEFSRRWGRA